MINCYFFSDAYQEQIRQEREHRLSVQRELDELKSKCTDHGTVAVLISFLK